MGVNRGKVNERTRKFIDDLVKPVEEGGLVTTECICTKVNSADRRRRYNTISIGNLLAERDDLKKTSRGWIKLKSNVGAEA